MSEASGSNYQKNIDIVNFGVTYGVPAKLQILYDNLIFKYGNRLISIEEFKQEFNYKIDDYTFNKMWNNLNDDLPLLVDDDLIQFIGFSAENKKNRKQKFLDLLKRNQIEYNSYNYESYNKLIEEKELPDSYIIPKDTKNITQINYILMNVDDFKEAVIICNTEKAKLARKYMLSIEKLIKMYDRYQKYYESKKNMMLELDLKEIKEQNNKLIEQNNKTNEELKEIKNQNNELLDHSVNIENKLDTAINERAVKTINRKLWHKLIIVDIGNINNPKYNGQNYYTIRAQRIRADTACQK